MADSEAGFRSWAEPLLARLAGARMTVFGDFCLDTYWLLDSEEQEISIETGLAVHRVRTQEFSLGGAGSVVANLAALGVGTIRAVGVIGTDPFGRQLTELLARRGVDLDGWLEDPTIQTMAYGKPFVGTEESSRIDFGAFNRYSEALQDRLMARLRCAVGESDVVIVNQQVPGGLISPGMIERINQLAAEHPETIFLVDSRHSTRHFKGVTLKLNMSEAARLLGESERSEYAIAEAEDFARRIHASTGKAVFLTRGERGIVAMGVEGTFVSVPGLQVEEPMDTVGAGDAVVAAVAAAMAVGEPAGHAAQLANVAASVTVRQLRCTGTASGEQILEAAGELKYVFQPELAASLRLARYVSGTEIEVTGELPARLEIGHVVFDHDGTLSVLREGWERVMEGVMLRAVLGSQHDSADKATLERLQRSLRELIDRTTGLPTLMQMRGLVGLIRLHGFVDETEMLDEYGYKALFNEELLRMIGGRMEKLRRGELSASDFQVKNAAVLLDELYGRGVKLYLASGTDQADVIRDAEALGYARFFEGRIFGAVADARVEAKKMVLDRIIKEHDLGGHQFATFGDGAVEMRETERRGGVAVGVASDELRRFGLNPAKRKRLIRAGAHLIISDYSQVGALLKVLQLQ